MAANQGGEIVRGLRQTGAEVTVIADRLFDGKAWTVSVHTRPNGTRFFQVTELAGARTAWPTLGDDGVVQYDRSETLPFSVKVWVRKTLVEYQPPEVKQ